MTGALHDSVRLHIVSGQRRYGQDHRSRRALAGARLRWTPGPALRGRGPTGDRVAVRRRHRCRTTSVGIAVGPDGGQLFALAIDTQAALLEYLDMFYRLGRAGKALDRFGVIDFATTIAPGLRDVLLTGKVYEATRRRDGNGFPVRLRGARCSAHGAHW